MATDDANAAARPGGRMLAILGSGTFRIAALSLVAFVLAAALIFTALFLKTNDALTQLTLSAVRADAEAILGDKRAASLPGLVEVIAARAALPGPGLYRLSDPSGRRLAGNLDPLPLQLAAQDKANKLNRTRLMERQHRRPAC